MCRCYETLAGASTDPIYRGWYRLCVACWIILGLASCAGLIAVLQDVYSTLLNRAEGKTAAAVRTDKRRMVADAATSAAADDEDGDTSAVRHGDVSSQSGVTDLDDRQEQRL